MSRSSCWLLAGLLFVPGIIHAEAIILTGNEMPRASIVVGYPADEDAVTAAFEFNDYIEKITGARLPMWRIPVEAVESDFYVLIGQSDSLRPGGYGGRWGDLWVTTRPTKDDPWGEPVNLGPTVNSAYTEMTPSISADGSTLYFESDRPGGFGGHDLWQAPISPVVDLNGDGIVDSADMCIVVDHWGTEDSLCDIGPMPFGDGIVDVQDLIVLAEHLFEEVPPLE